MSAQITTSQWRARLLLGYRKRADRTVLAAREHYGPLTVQKPFYPEGGVCHTYLLHPPGGIAPGDHLSLDIALEEQAEVLVTTPAAGKFYRCDQRDSSLRQHLHLAHGAVFEWLPQESIAFNGCLTELFTRVELADEALFFGWDMICLGRPASGELFASGTLRQRFEFWRRGQPLLLERSLYTGGSEVLHKPWGMSNRTVAGTLIANHADETALRAARAECEDGGDALIAVTRVGDFLICRCLADGAETVRNCFIRIWKTLRPLLRGREGVVPRIWNT